MSHFSRCSDKAPDPRAALQRPLAGAGAAQGGAGVRAGGAVGILPQLGQPRRDPGALPLGRRRQDLSQVMHVNIKLTGNRESGLRGCPQMTSAFFGVSDTPWSLVVISACHHLLALPLVLQIDAIICPNLATFFDDLLP